MKPVFLSAEWRHLVMANYALSPGILQPYLPYKTELDFYDGKCYVSLVGFRFLKVKIRGFSIPFHVNFPEVNLRFYTRYKENGVWKRGVVFISEIVPKPAIAFVANYLYGEKYATALMKSAVETANGQITVQHQWKWNGRWNSMQVQAAQVPVVMAEGSQEEFITEHYWGYSFRNELMTYEYGVEHPRWNIHPISSYHIDCNFESVYGKTFAGLDQEKPESVFLAEGSPVIIRGKTVIV
ncbi:MAG TPA: DUF2071 domain-containing protein [Chitinophagaceae bacterium]|nr:DUF2071 domain-containing protein [Chitinophagaceae bacterium]